VIDLLLPKTDAGVAIQVILWAALLVGALFVTRKDKDLRLLAVGLGALTLGLLAARAIH